MRFCDKRAGYRRFTIFIWIRLQREHLRLAILVFVCKEYFTARTIVFFRSKVFAHRVRVVFDLLDSRQWIAREFESGAGELLLLLDPSTNTDLTLT